ILPRGDRAKKPRCAEIRLRAAYSEQYDPNRASRTVRPPQPTQASKLRWIMPATNEHAAYLGRTDYALPESIDLTKDEAALLRRYGHWMEALVSGKLEPTTPEQSHFVEVARGEAEARTDFERAWAKLSKQPEPSPSLFGRLIEARSRTEYLRQEKE